MKKLYKAIKYKFLMLTMPKGTKKRPSNVSAIVNTKSFYDFQLPAMGGKTVDFSAFKGKKVLITNIASKCGFTPQYDELEELHQKYNDKLVIIGFPANDFLGQEPGSDSDIESFCKINFGLSFQLFPKSVVIKGETQNPLYKWLSDKNENGWNNKAPTWNFCKYLVNEKGELMAFYNSSVKPLSDDIVKEL
jgi:glutathione peroxidase